MFGKAAALLACILLFRILSAFAANFTGLVVSVLDSDTIEVLHNQYPERIRLNGIDCPEKSQAYGKRASKPPLN
jgi:endonuclease YncB( thermonuclease family)